MPIDLAAGTTTTPDQAARLHAACRYQHPDWEGGSTEPWIIDLVASLLLASGQTAVLELGGYKGACSTVLWQTLQKMGGGSLTVVEYDPLLIADLIHTLLPGISLLHLDALTAIDALPDRSIGFCWVDDTHFPDHVNLEIQALLPKMLDGGLICFHDVIGSYNLQALLHCYGGYSLDLPRVSTAGGLGILQVTPQTRLINPPTVTITPDGSDLIVQISRNQP